LKVSAKRILKAGMAIVETTVLTASKSV